LLESADIVIVGGGCVGCSIAFHAAKLQPGLKIILVERQHISWGATGRSTAIVRQHYSNPVTAGMALESLKVFENFPQTVGGEAGFTRTGFILAVGPRDEDALRRNVEMQRRVGIETGIIGPGEIEKLQPGANVKDIAAAAFEPRSGYADPSATTKSFAAAAEQRGVKILEQTKVLEILENAGRVKGVKTEGGDIAAERVVNAANVWANQIMPRKHSRLPIRVLREQSCVFVRPREFTRGLTVWGDFLSGFYFCPRGADRLVVGSLESNLPELDDPDNCEGVDYGTVMSYSEKLFNRFPAMAQGRWERGWSGPYDVTPDWHPILDESKEIEGLYLAVGFSGHGFKLSPAVGSRMAELLVGGKKPQDLGMFSASRFSEEKLVTGQYESNIIA
jgi:glycine/D-amino acid oxidase-like deaminating enzyme